MASKDLSKGKPWKVLLFFALPMILSVMLQQVYYISDSMIAGKYLGENALSAISAAYPIVMLFIGLATGAGAGTNIISSRFFGMKKNKEVKTTIYTSYITFISFAIILTIIGILSAERILLWLNTDPDILADATKYLRLYCLGLIFTFLYNITYYAFHALGNSKTPLYFLIFSTFFNVFLSLFFSLKFNMGVSGIALATVIAQGSGGVLAFSRLILIVRKIESGKPKKYSIPILKNILSISIPSMIQCSIVAIGGLFIQGEVNKYGTEVTAGFGAAFKLCYIVINLILAFTDALASFVSQNIGSGTRKRIIKGYRACLIMVCSVSVLASVIYYLLAPQLLQLFIQDGGGETVLDSGVKFLYIVTPFYLVAAFKISFDGIFKGSGDMFSYMLGTLTDLTLRIVLTFILSYKFGFIGIWWSWPLGWIGAGLVALIMFLTGRWKKVNKLNLLQK